MNPVNSVFDESHSTPNGQLSDVNSHRTILEDPINYPCVNGNRICTNFASSHPVMFVPKYDGSMAKKFHDEFYKSNALFARYLEHFVAERVSPLHWTKEKLARNFDAENELKQKLSVKRDQIVDNRQRHQRLQYLQERKTFQKELAEARKEEKQADKVAAENAAAIGRLYDPEKSTIEGLFTSMSNEAAAADLNLPYGQTVFKILLVSRLSWLLNSISGAVAGLSLAVASGWVDNPSVNPSPIGLILAALGGVGVFTLARKALSLAFILPAQTLFLSRRSLFTLSLIVGLFIFLAVLGVWAAIDREGILKAAVLRPGVEQPSEILLWLLAGSLALGALLYASFEAWELSRQDSVMNSIAKHFESSNVEAAKQRANDRNCVKALDSFSAAIASKQRVKRFESELKLLDERNKNAIAALDQQRLSYPTGWDEYQKRQIQQVQDQLLRNTIEYDTFCLRAGLGREI